MVMEVICPHCAGAKQYVDAETWPLPYDQHFRLQVKECYYCSGRGTIDFEAKAAENRAWEVKRMQAFAAGLRKDIARLESELEDAKRSLKIAEETWRSCS